MPTHEKSNKLANIQISDEALKNGVNNEDNALQTSLESSDLKTGKGAVNPDSHALKPTAAVKKGDPGWLQKLTMGAKNAWKETKATGKDIGYVLANPKEALYQSILEDPDRLSNLLVETADIPNQDIIYEQLAHLGAYGKLNGKEATWGYLEAGYEVDEETGFAARLYVPTDEMAEGTSAAAKAMIKLHGRPLEAVVAFRGTVNKKGALEGTNEEGIGSYQFTANAAAIHGLFDAAGGKAAAIGHSLGGSLAQFAGSHMPESVSRVVTFQSPAINKEDTDKLAEHNEGASKEDQVQSSHYRATGDFVHTLGESLTPGTVTTFDAVGVGIGVDHRAFPLASLNAARNNPVAGVSGKDGQVAEDNISSAYTKDAAKGTGGFINALADSTRRGASALYEMGAEKNGMEEYVALWSEVEALIETGESPMKEVLSLIESNKDILPQQKSRMKSNALSLQKQHGGAKNAASQ